MPCSFFRIDTVHGTQLGFDSHRNLLCHHHAGAHASRVQPVLAAMAPGRPDALFLLNAAEPGRDLSLLASDWREAVLALRLVPAAVPDQVLLTHPLTRLHLCAEPVTTQDDVGHLPANRPLVGLWEVFRLVPVDAPAAGPEQLRVLDALASLSDPGQSGGSGLQAYLADRMAARSTGVDTEAANAAAFAAVTTLLPLDQATELARAVADTPGLAERLAGWLPQRSWTAHALQQLAVGGDAVTARWPSRTLGDFTSVYGADAQPVHSNDHYEVVFYDSRSPNVTVVFSSAAALALAQPIAEFRNTIRQFDTSYVFVLSRQLDWYNNIDAWPTLRAVSAFCRRFGKVYALGESLGGSGALLFARFCPFVHRVLAFSPQYSALPSFCKFFGALTPLDGAIPRFAFADYAPPAALGRSVLIFPSRSYEDNLHSRLFLADGFDVVYIRCNDHAIARFLKNARTNHLTPVLACLYDDTFGFDAASYKALLHPVLETHARPYVHWIGDMTFRHDELLEPSPFPLLSQNRPALQSSVAPDAPGRSPAAEATRATTLPLDAPPVFQTGFERNPWWTVDLERVCRVRRVTVFNRCDHREAAQKLQALVVLTSADGVTWRVLYEKKDPDCIGGLYGVPLVIETDVHARHVKLTVPDHAELHLSRVEVHGEELAEG